MLETIMRLYVMAMALDIRSPLPHLVGPPGCGKSTVVEQLADLVGKKLHIINVSRLSPLDVEGVQMPHGTGEDMVLKMLPATFWTSLKEGDIILYDEFLRGFPEVYNSLLDVMTSRRVGAYWLPKVFMIGASNSVVSYDKALEDRLLHLPVPDPRNSKKEKQRLAELIVSALGLLPEMAKSMEVMTLLEQEVLPMYDLLDSFKHGKSNSAPTQLKGRSLRNLIGQALLREVQCVALAELIAMNNNRAVQQGKHQYVFLLDGKNQYGWFPAWLRAAEQMRGNPKLTEFQATNLELNLQLVEMESIRIEKKGEVNEDDDVFLDLD